MKRIKFRKCQKCNKPKRLSKNPLCQKCIYHKQYSINPDLSPEDIEWLVEEMNIFTHRLKVTQRNIVDLFDLNDIIENHYKIYARDYIGNNLTAGEQLEIMWNDILRFLTVYGR